MKLLMPILIVAVSVCRNEAVQVNSSQQLNEELHKLSTGVTNLVLELDSSVEYKLYDGNFSYFTNKSVTIRSTDTHKANITCVGNEKINHTGGIAFINSSVTFAKISFKFCGKLLKALPKIVIDSLNSSSPLYYTHDHAAALLFVNCKVHMDTVKIESSFGFALIGFNLESSSFQFLTICHSMYIFDKNRNTFGRGSGMMLHFNNIQRTITTLSLLKSSFEVNEDFTDGRECSLEIYKSSATNPKMLHKQLISAAGLTIVYTRMHYKANVTISEVNFTNNTGGYAGAILILHFQNTVSCTVTLNSSFLTRNSINSSSDCHGAGLQSLIFGSSLINNSSLLSIDNTYFNETKQSGAIFVGLYASNSAMTFYFTNLHCFRNKPMYGGSCMTIAMDKLLGKGSVVTAVLTNITAVNNSDYVRILTSSFNFENINKVIFTGISKFENNFGSAIYTRQSDLYLSGDMSFSNNTGEKGGGIRLEENCLLYLMEGLKANFSGNRAYLFGGAIYANSNYYNKCAIQIKNHSTNTIKFSDNLAKLAGNSVFATPTNLCEVNGQYRKHWIKKLRCYLNLPHHNRSSVNTLQPFSTSPFHFSVLYREKDKYEHIRTSQLLETFPGQTLFFATQTQDGEYINVFSYVNIEVLSNNYSYSQKTVWLKQSGGNVAVEGERMTPKNLSIHTTSRAAIEALLIFSIPGTFVKTYTIQLLPCPLGFSLETGSGTGSCECSKVITKLLESECFINEKIIFLKKVITDYWIGMYNNRLAVSTSCPLDYCNTDPHNRFIKVTEERTLYKNKKGEIPFCLHNRQGVLCGQCNQTNHFSAVFGSMECRKCSNWWLLSVVIYIIAGPLLIYILYVFKLTLTIGTLNGVIFYAQAANAGLIQLMSLSYEENSIMLKIHKICYIVLGFLNLNVGFPHCFFNEMNQLWKTGLSLAYPVYLQIIATSMIVLSHYSTKFSNRTSHSSVQVLVTVVHLSFSKLLLALIDVFTPATIHTEDRSYCVWYWDGSVEYMGPSHYPLAIAAAVIASLLIVPYISLLLLGKPLVRFSKIGTFYIRPILEAIHAPYKEGRQYWFVARLLLIIIVYIMYVLLRTRNDKVLNVTISSLLLSFLIGQALFRPFKSKLINLLDCWLMTNVTLAYITMWNNNRLSTSINGVVIISAILTFGVIIAYHILMVTHCLDKITNKLIDFRRKFLKLLPQQSTRIRQLQNTDSYYESCQQYREPLFTD